MLQNKYDFVYLFDVTNGNPNGDPDAGNEPRVDAETGTGYVTDVCLKRKVRNYVDLVKNGAEGYNILIKNDKPLNDKFKAAYAAVQFSFADSISPIAINNVTITRQAKTDETRAATGDTEMGTKNIVPYALYRMSGHISAALANKVTGLSEEDVELLWQALLNMFDEDRSAARGDMEVRGLYVFKHDNILGNVRFPELDSKINVTLKDGVVVPRRFEDYEVTVNKDLPAGVTLIAY